jgi:ABC-type thiamine transport system ATPase subunit
MPDPKSQMETTSMASAHNQPGQRRKLIAFDAETWSALDLLARDSMKSIQELADEAFADLLKKHHRPTDVRQALRESARLTSGKGDRAGDPKRRRSGPTK